jgi:hypothetical protein
LMIQLFLFIDGMRFHHIWVIGMVYFWHKCQVAENLTKINLMHTMFYALYKPLKSFCL